MSPEMYQLYELENNDKEVSDLFKKNFDIRKSDVYSLGLVLICMFYLLDLD